MTLSTCRPGSRVTGRAAGHPTSCSASSSTCGTRATGMTPCTGRAMTLQATVGHVFPVRPLHWTTGLSVISGMHRSSCHGLQPCLDMSMQAMANPTQLLILALLQSQAGELVPRGDQCAGRPDAPPCRSRAPDWRRHCSYACPQQLGDAHSPAGGTGASAAGHVAVDSGL